MPEIAKRYLNMGLAQLLTFHAARDRTVIIGYDEDTRYPQLTVHAPDCPHYFREVVKHREGVGIVEEEMAKAMHAALLKAADYYHAIDEGRRPDEE